MLLIVETFFFYSKCVAGSRLKKKNDAESTEGLDTDLWDRNPSSTFLTAANRKGIADSARKRKNKSSIDCADIAMNLQGCFLYLLILLIIPRSLT